MQSTSASPAPEWLVTPDDANDLARAVWPASAHRTENGEFVIGGVPASDLVREHGTPLQVLDEGEVRRRAAALRDAFDAATAAHGTSARIYYAGKALLNTTIVRWMLDEGLNVDVCTGGELEVALRAGADAARLGFHGNNKSVAELERAVEAGVGTIIIDSTVEIERLGRVVADRGAEQRVMLRVNSGVHAETHDFLATAHEDQKFGFPLVDAPEAVALIRRTPGLIFAGLHCHIGSQIFGVAGFRESAERVLALHEQLLTGGEVPQLNLGGGFGIAYTRVDDPVPITELAEGIVAAVAETCERRGIAMPALSFEPGRAIVGNAGVTLYEVGTIKDVTLDQGIRRYVSVDGGMSDNARPALYGAQYSARLASRVSEAAPALVRVVGKHCESGDIVVDHEYLPGDVAPGDLLAVAATGAYCAPLSSNYNHVTRPPIVAVRDGAAHVIVRGESMADLLARDAGITP
ncbi:diaminopimelate decarboxylase [Microbacterium esteraromaticum]|uniref:Diaminopimelate decarboxylase n=1 Tax=Microbacterium esteraromaticum TaxID=57043 RepID=A0A939IT28_9MICO|nr:diaminopimelate decarboxylase [Microbacterium esteraromaticum]MBN8415946.1 diaminopimelate decarboxylase [Microbacterium esteraromaticum]MBN8423715.1 diaminopimelate decarboxylase [Microbacterium esteraromaticum]